MIAAWSSWTPSPTTALLVLLVAGHLLADFLVLTRDHVEAKDRGDGFARHGVFVLVTHLIVLAPMSSIYAGVAVVVVAVLHVVIDRVKCRWVPESWGRLKPFALDQAAHLVVIFVVWGVLARSGTVPAFRWLSAAQMGTYLGGAVLASAFAFNANGGSVIVAGILNVLSRNEEDVEGDEGPAGYAGAGRMIGILERTLMLAMVLYGQWAAIALLVTAKSIARFEEIKVRKFAEYYLVGTLASLLVALVVGFLLTELLFPQMM